MDTLTSLSVPLVSLAGTPLAEPFATALSELRVHSMLGTPGQCEIRFEDPPTDLMEASRQWIGEALAVSTAAGERPLFEGEVCAVELRHGPSGERDIWVRGYDALHRLRQSQPVRIHLDCNVADLAKVIAAPHGLPVRASESGPLVRSRAQVREDDLAFLVRIAREAGLYPTLRDGELALITLAGEGEVRRLYLDRDVIELHSERNVDPARRSVEADGWSPAFVRSARATSTNARTPQASPGSPARPDGRGDAVLTERDIDDVGHAMAAAQAELDWRTAASLTVRGRVLGDPSLRPGARLELVGHPEPGPHVLTEVHHSIDTRTGFTTEFTSAPPPPLPDRSGATLTLGRVTRVDDDDGLARVKAELPAYGDIETDWMPVVGAGAGASKGFLFLPDLGDHVAVLLIHGDAGTGVVLGGLYGEHTPPEPRVKGPRITGSVWQSAGDQRIHLDADTGARIDAKRFQLEVLSGSSIGLADEEAHLRAATDLVIEAPGKRIVFRARRIDFEEASSS